MWGGSYCFISGDKRGGRGMKEYLEYVLKVEFIDELELGWIRKRSDIGWWVV